MQNNPKIHLVIPIYWVTLLLWQVFRPVANRSIIDVSFKIALLSVFVLYMFFKSSSNKFSIIYLIALIIYASSQIISLSNNNDILNPSYLVDFLFSLILIFIFIILNGNIRINTKEMLVFSNSVIGIVFFLTAYADLFQASEIIKALQTTSGYLNAVTSMVASNHEFGLYSVFGIASSVFVILNTKINSRKKRKYYFFIVYFMVHLFLTFSRTSILALSLSGLIAIILRKKKSFFILTVLGIVVLMILVIPDLNRFIFDIVLRIDHDGNRSMLIESGISYFLDANIFEKIFGIGKTNTSIAASKISGNNSFHNAYITILLNGGIIMFVFLMSILANSLIKGIKSLKFGKSNGAYIISVNLMVILFMWTQTPIIFTSDLLSFILTFYCIIIPRYYYNYLINKENMT